jgi:hypothetical protein
MPAVRWLAALNPAIRKLAPGNPHCGCAAPNQDAPRSAATNRAILRYLFVFIYLFVRQSCVFFQEWQWL